MNKSKMIDAHKANILESIGVGALPTIQYEKTAIETIDLGGCVVSVMWRRRGDAIGLLDALALAANVVREREAR